MRKVRTIEKVQFPAPDVAYKVIPAPTDGWDAISPLAEMDPKRAPILQNWVPRPGFVEVRGGFNTYSGLQVAGVTSAVETLMVYRSPTGEKFFAAAGGKIFDLTVPTAPVAVVTSLTNNRWQYTNFTPDGSSSATMVAVNGADPLREYDGTTWTTPAVTGLPGGRTSSSIIHVLASKRRLWYTLKDSTIAAYMPTDAIIGPIAGIQDLAALWSKGGYLVGVASWTIDGGAGPRDYVVFISSRGQLTLYAGTDPTSSASWSIVGTFDIAPPIGRRCFTRVGSDVLLITQDGVLPISQALPFDPSSDRSVAITARIQNAMTTATSLYKNNFGWQVISHPDQQLIFLNVPITEGNQQQQFVMNALTGAWCQFTGWPVNCFEIFNNNLYFGDDNGMINQAYIGASDGGESIPADMQCAFNWFDEPGRAKRMTMLQPLLTTGGTLIPSVAIDTDFSTSIATAPVTTLAAGSLWDVAKWDVDVWSGGTVNTINWLTVNAIGHSMAVRLRVNVIGPGDANAALFDFAKFDVAVFDGGLGTLLPVLQLNAFNSIIEYGGAI